MKREIRNGCACTVVRICKSAWRWEKKNKVVTCESRTVHVPSSRCTNRTNPTDTLLTQNCIYNIEDSSCSLDKSEPVWRLYEGLGETAAIESRACHCDPSHIETILEWLSADILLRKLGKHHLISFCTCHRDLCIEICPNEKVEPWPPFGPDSQCDLVRCFLFFHHQCIPCPGSSYIIPKRNVLQLTSSNGDSIMNGVYPNLKPKCLLSWHAIGRKPKSLEAESSNTGSKRRSKKGMFLSCTQHTTVTPEDRVQGNLLSELHRSHRMVSSTPSPHSCLLYSQSSIPQPGKAQFWESHVKNILERLVKVMTKYPCRYVS